MIPNEKTVCLDFYNYFRIETKFGCLYETDIKSNQLCKFISYLALNRKSIISPDVLTAIIWPQGSDDPYGNLRGLACRTRKILAPIFPEKDLIIPKNGAYIIDPFFDLNIDTEILENRISKMSYRQASSCNDIENDLKFLDKHCGAFLESLSSDIWCMPVGTFYNSKLLSYISSVLDVALKLKMYDTVLNYASKGLHIDPLSEELHSKIITALLYKGNRKLALDYFGNVVNMFQNDYSINPTAHFMSIKQKLANPEII